MIISQDILPEKNLYYIGGIILSILKQKGNHNLLFMYEEYLKIMKNKTLESVGLEIFFLAVDWLYLINAVARNDKTNTFYLVSK